MKKFIIQLETNLDLFDIAKIVDKYEKIGSIKVKSIVQDFQEEYVMPEFNNKEVKRFFDYTDQIISEGKDEQSREK